MFKFHWNCFKNFLLWCLVLHFPELHCFQFIWQHVRELSCQRVTIMPSKCSCYIKPDMQMVNKRVSGIIMPNCHSFFKIYLLIITLNNYIYNTTKKKKNTSTIHFLAWGCEISLLVLKKYFTRSLLSLVGCFSTLEEGFRISARQCNILYLFHCPFVLLYNFF